MSRRLIITEEEKNRIKLLYETVMPPSESVLITNKNPFKDNEYFTARRDYNASLKDGDLFYVFIGRKEEFDTFVTEYNKDKWLKLPETLIGKSVRSSTNQFEDKDKIYQIDDVKITGFTNNASSFKGNMTIKDTSNNVIIQTDIGYGPQGLLSDTVFFSKSTDIARSQSLQKFFGEFHNRLITCVYPSDGNFKIKDNNSMSKLPDEFFEIRKIERQKTDF